LPTGIGAITHHEKGEYILFPNPLRDILYVRRPAVSTQEEISIYNSMLQRTSLPVSNINQGEYKELDTSILLPGVYFLEIKREKKMVLKRFVKN
jgi:hypothetical protein